jgi:hypothetical protein
MPRHLEITLEQRGARAVARLLDDAAPRTCDAVWAALPLSAPAFHGKYARNEVYHLVPGFADPEPGPENTSVTPIPGDLMYFSFSADQLFTPSHGYRADETPSSSERVVDLAYFYGRNNLLLNGDQGWVPGNVFGTIVEGLDALAAASQDLWLRGVEGERLAFRRLEDR